jgi:hypothetical protein
MHDYWHQEQQPSFFCSSLAIFKFSSVYCRVPCRWLTALGRSAFDAVVLMNVGVISSRAHHYRSSGPLRHHKHRREEPNVFNRTEVLYLIRAPKNQQVKVFSKECAISLEVRP